MLKEVKPVIDPDKIIYKAPEFRVMDVVCKDERTANRYSIGATIALICGIVGFFITVSVLTNLILK